MLEYQKVAQRILLTKKRELLGIGLKHFSIFSL
jgi:hypothetical protein